MQAAAKLLLEPIFEQDFEPNSYGFRPDKSAHMAVMEVVKWLNFGYEQVVDADITACFDTIPHGKLMKQVARRVADGAVLHLIKQWLDAGVMEDGLLAATEEGTPQGSPISPLLANIYLDQLDKAWKGSSTHLVRYADDFVILGKQGTGEEAMKKLTAIIADMLTLSAEKTRVVKAEDGFEFLGFRLVRHYSKVRNKRVTYWFPSAKSRKRIR
ncbi:MAG: reverse transcriptase domain-containing protein [Nitrososphaeria archaeon]